jgi:hypothetical protein
MLRGQILRQVENNLVAARKVARRAAVGGQECWISLSLGAKSKDDDFLQRKLI